MRIRRLVAVVVAVLVTGAWSCAPGPAHRGGEPITLGHDDGHYDVPECSHTCGFSGHHGTG